MKTIVYDKLVRDNIPKIIEGDNKTCVIETLSDEEYAEKLCDKLFEEVNEFLLDFRNEKDEDAIRELADLVEVINAILAFIGIDKMDFEKIRLAKKLSHGGFEKKICLKAVKYE